MANEIEQIAEQNGMAVEFVAWFFNEKKASCGNVWFMMMAAMWEGWKVRDSELTAALATIEKCREITNCPAGVDLQDHLRQLASENVGLKAANNLALNILNDEETMVTSLWASSVQHVEATTPATDSIYAGIKADGVEEFALMFAEESIKDDIITGCWKAKASRAASEYAELLREGAK